MSEDKPRNIITAVGSGALNLRSDPATVKGTAAVKSAVEATLNFLHGTTPAIKFTGDDIAAFLEAAKELEERTVRIAMYSPDTSFESIGLDTGPLSENDARLALENYFEVQAGNRKYRKGVIDTLLTAAGGLITMVVGAWLLIKFGLK